jgi:uncharacterized membrane protein
MISNNFTPTCLAAILGWTVAVITGSATAEASLIYNNFVTVDGPGDSAGGTAVNAVANNGALVGFGMNAAQTVLTSFIRNLDGTSTVLNTGNNGFANGINVNDTVVGQALVGNTIEAFVLNGPLLSFLPPNPTGSGQTAFGINDNGIVVGQYVNTGTTNPGFVYSNGTFTALNPTVNAFQTFAQGVNDNGLVTGFYSVDGVHEHGFFYNIGTGTYTLPADPVQPNLALVQLLGINDNNMAAGYWQDNNGDQHGLLYNFNTHQYTFLDDPNQAVFNGQSFTQITGINDSNRIAGFFVDGNGLQHGFFADPSSAAPEPGSFGLLGMGIGVMVSLSPRRWRSARDQRMR